jgi:hypothetical protein
VIEVAPARLLAIRVSARFDVAYELDLKYGARRVGSTEYGAHIYNRKGGIAGVWGVIKDNLHIEKGRS